MKLLFDQNISFRILKEIDSLFPDSKQVRELGLENSTDSLIWAFARDNGYSVVTFDADFADISNLNGCPPKIIWLRTGNMTTKNIVTLLKDHHLIISEFIQSDEHKNICCLEIE